MTDTRAEEGREMEQRAAEWAGGLDMEEVLGGGERCLALDTVARWLAIEDVGERDRRVRESLSVTLESDIPAHLDRDVAIEAAYDAAYAWYERARSNT